MRKSKLSSKIKEPVRLRAKKLANGCRSLYLDTYNKGHRHYEFLRLYLNPEKTATDKAINEATLKAANAIKAERTLTLIAGKADIGTQRTDYTVDEWKEHIIKEKSGTTSTRLMRRLGKHLQIFRKDALLANIDRDFCMGFANYLRSASALNSKKPLMQGTRFELLNALSVMLNEAVRKGIIPNNPMRQLSASERIKKPESSREYLTSDEVARLLKASSENVKDADDVAAFLFCCFCGLRYSDVTALKWGNIIETSVGKEINITMKKTRRQVTIPLSTQACSLLPPQGTPDANVFTFPSYGRTLLRLKKAAEAAGIRKKVTFHVSRHTFATMMLTAGADLYTISKLVGHADIRTTQIYAKVVDRRKREAITLLDRLF